MFGGSVRWAIVAGMLPLAAAAQEPQGDAAGRLSASIDAALTTEWSEADYKPSSVDDATFLRRVYLDLVGTLPSVAAAHDFLNDTSDGKRDRLIDTLLADARNAEHLARVWRRIIAPPGGADEMAVRQLEPWLSERFAENTRFDDLVRRLVTGSYEGDQVAATTFRQVSGGAPPDVADATSRIFLGVRIGCARCHDHPFTAWKQSDFWGVAAFFGEQAGTGSPVSITSEHGTAYRSRFLGDEVDTSIPNGRRPADVFAEWMTSEENPFFAATVVNRTWQQLVGRGLIAEVDDLDLAEAEERQVALDQLAETFAQSGYELRTLLAAICKSRAYQSAEPASPISIQGTRPLKVLAPEQVFSSLEQALMLPVSRFDGSPRFDGQRDAFVRRLAETMGRSPEDFQAGVPQALVMMNGRLMDDAIDLEDSRTLRAVVEAPFLSPSEKIETLYLGALTRKPRPDELATMLRHVENRSAGEQQFLAYSEIFWAILNSPEFVLSR
jgi:hypothetical protein